MKTQSKDGSFDLIPARLAVAAMRDSGYRNTAYAVAELIDNSIQAEAQTVELICLEEDEVVRARARRRIRAIAVLDDGSGMDMDVLRMALQFGNGTHLRDRDGIGRFGMGLPSASISQCSRVEVWSWKGSPESALYTYIDLAEVADGRQTVVPEPVSKAVPDEWVQRSSGLANSGTLVVWSKLDRCMWLTGRSIIRNSEFVIARMYRKFLSKGMVSIRMVCYVAGDPAPTIDQYAQPNDPLYLMTPTSTPEPYDTTPMFQTDGSAWEVLRRISFNGETHKVAIRFSLAKEDVRSTPQAGQKPHGRHAARNIGVSLIRAGRELDLDQALVNGYDPRERWWGVEIDFPPALDELFGVTNNKQAARNFTEVAERIEVLKADNQNNWAEYKRTLEEDEDPTAPLIDLIDFLVKRINVMRQTIKIQSRGSGHARRRHDPTSPEAVATEVTKKRKEEGWVGNSDAGESLPEEQRTKELADELEDAGYSRTDAQALAASTISSGIKYTFAEAALEGMSFFTVKSVAGEVVIKINVNHPAYKNLDQVLAAEPGEQISADELRSRLSRASLGLRLLLLAWARFEDEQPGDRRRAEIQEVRNQWGMMAYRFLEDE